MTTNIYCITRNDDGRMVMDHVDEWDGPLGEILHETRKHWNEGDGAQTFLFTDENGYPRATMTRPAYEEDPEVCLTTYCDGSSTMHRCHYVLDGDGCYLRTEIEELDPVC